MNTSAGTSLTVVARQIRACCSTTSSAIFCVFGEGEGGEGEGGEGEGGEGEGGEGEGGEGEGGEGEGGEGG